MTNKKNGSRENEPPTAPGQPGTRARCLTTAFIFYVTLFAVVIDLSSPGISWDEPYYLSGGYNYILPWFGRLGKDALTRPAIEAHWKPVARHPPLGEIAIGLFRSAGESWLGPVAAGRLAGAVFFASLCAAVFWFAVRRWGYLCGFSAVTCFAFTPRVFGHAHFAALDIPAAASWFFTVVAFVYCLERRGRSWPLAGLAWGCALLTKSTVLPLPVLLLGWCAVFQRRDLCRAALGLLAAIPVFFLWPWMWIDTWPHLKEYLGVVGIRPQISVFYFGHQLDLFDVPWHYPLVMVVGATPVFILAAAAGGAWLTARRRAKDRIAWLLIANVGFFLCLASLPGMAKYDGIRLYLPVYPFLALLAGIGLSHISGFISDRRLKYCPTVLLAIYLLAWLVAVQPFYLSDYGAAAGGIRGADRLGLETTYWLEAVDAPTVQFVNSTSPQNARLAIYPYAEFLTLFHRDRGTFRSDIVLLGKNRLEDWNVLILVCRKGLFDETAWKLFREGKPVFERSLRGVPLVKVFRKPNR